GVKFAFSHSHVFVSGLHIASRVLARPSRHLADLLDQLEFQAVNVGLGELLIDTGVFGDDSHKLVDDRLDGVFTAQTVIERLGLSWSGAQQERRQTQPNRYYS